MVWEAFNAADTGYVAVGISKDTKMGDDLVMACTDVSRYPNYIFTMHSSGNDPLPHQFLGRIEPSKFWYKSNRMILMIYLFDQFLVLFYTYFMGVG